MRLDTSIHVSGYGESEDDRVFPAYQIDGKRAPKPVRRGNWNFNRGTTPPSFSTDLQRKVWPNCDWLPNAAPVWKMSQDTTDAAYASDLAGTSMKASPFIACTPRNPNDPTKKSRCVDQTTETDCTASKAQSGASYCTWDGAECHIDEGVAGGIGLVKYPSTGGGDSGAAVWYVVRRRSRVHLLLRPAIIPIPPIPTTDHTHTGTSTTRTSSRSTIGTS